MLLDWVGGTHAPSSADGRGRGIDVKAGGLLGARLLGSIDARGFLGVCLCSFDSLILDARADWATHSGEWQVGCARRTSRFRTSVYSQASRTSFESA